MEDQTALWFLCPFRCEEEAIGDEKIAGDRAKHIRYGDAISEIAEDRSFLEGVYQKNLKVIKAYEYDGVLEDQANDSAIFHIGVEIDDVEQEHADHENAHETRRAAIQEFA